MNKTTPAKSKSKLKKKKPSPSPKSKLESIKKSIPTSRNPLTDLNTTTRSNSNTQTHFTSSNSSTNTRTSSSISIETPKGCLPFFPSKRFNKTPKSAPISKFRSKPPISHKPQSTRLLNKSENDKDCIFRDLNHTHCPKSSPDVKECGSGSGSYSITQHWKFSRSIDEDDNGKGTTPVVDKVGGSGKEDTTPPPPPVEASISPEIQCVSSFMSNSSSCFGAGHILSGVTDKRKCRPRGLLAVEEKKDSGLFKGGGLLGFDMSRASLVPVPIEASMYWLSPMRVEENDQKENVVNEYTPFSTPSSISGNGDSTRMSDLDSGGLLGSEAGMSNKERGYLYESPATNNSLSSGGDSFGSYNAVCTPKSDSSLDEGVARSSGFENTKGSIFEFDSISNGYTTPSLSPKNRPSKGNAADVLPLPGFSFQFSHPNRLSTHSIDQTQLQKNSDDSWVDSSNCGKSSHSQMRVSWRDGLVSRMLEMEDLDCCRVFSDEEDEVGYKVNENVVQDPSATEIAVPEKVVFKEPKTADQQNVKVLENSSSCAESISTEGGDLTTSRDSDWDLCYKNQLFIE